MRYAATRAWIPLVAFAASSVVVLPGGHGGSGTGPSPAGADHVVDWLGAGVRMRAVVPSPLVLRFSEQRRRLLEFDSELLRSHARESLDAELTPIFQELDGRAPDMAAWAFRWRTSYALLRRGVPAALADLGEGPLLAWRTHTAAVVQEKFAELVLRGEETSWRLDAIRQRWLLQAKETVDAVFAGHDQVGAAFVRQGTWAEFPVVTVEETVPATPRVPDAVPPPRGDAALDEAQVGALQARAGRPLVSRAVIRLPGVLSGTALGDTAAAATGIAEIGGAAGLAAAIAGTLAFDFLVSRADALASREQWENEVRQGLQTWRRDLCSQWMVEINDYIDDRRRLATASLHAEPRPTAGLPGIRGGAGSARSGGEP